MPGQLSHTIYQILGIVLIGVGGFSIIAGLDRIVEGVRRMRSPLRYRSGHGRHQARGRNRQSRVAMTWSPLTA